MGGGGKLMATLTLNSTGYRYGWAASNQGSGSLTFYMGRVDNGDHTRQYDASIQFDAITTPPWGTSPIVIKSIKLNTTRAGKGNAYNNLDIYLSLQSEAYPGAYEKIVSSETAFNSTEVTLNNSFYSYIAQYLMNKNTFYIHITGEKAGGSIYGYNKATRPTLTIEWDYANSTGSLSKTNFNCGEEGLKLYLNVKGTNYSHTISCFINGYSNGLINTTFITSKTEVFDISSFFKPDSGTILNWFPSTTIASGQLKIQTKNSSGESVGDIYEISFRLNLTADYYYGKTLTSLSLSFAPPSGQGLGNVFIANHSKVIISGSWNYTGGNSYKAILRIENGRSGIQQIALGDFTTSKVNFSTGNTEIVIGTASLQATLILTDSRGLVYSKTYISSSPHFYTGIQITKADLYRSNGTKAEVLGQKIGCDIIVSCDSVGGNHIKSIKVIYGSSSQIKTFSSVSSYYSYSTVNLFANINFLTNNTYTFKIQVEDQINTNGNLFGVSIYEYTVTVPKAEYIIHIPKGGKGIGFGTAYTEGIIGFDDPICIDCGWPVKITKGLYDMENSNKALSIKYGGTGTTTGNGACQNIGAVRISGDIMTGALQLAGNAYIRPSSADAVLLSYNYSNALGATKGTCLGYHGDTTTIRGSGILKHYAGTDSAGKSLEYNIASIGKNIFFAKDNGSGAPVGITAEEGMIWLKPIT